MIFNSQRVAFMLEQMRLGNPQSDLSHRELMDQLDAALGMASALREACDLALPPTREQRRDLASEGYKIARVPRFTHIGDVVVVARIKELRALAGPAGPEDPE